MSVLFSTVNTDKPRILKSTPRQFGRSSVGKSERGSVGWETTFLNLLRGDVDVKLLHINPHQADVADSITCWQRQKPDSFFFLLAVGGDGNQAVHSLALHNLGASAAGATRDKNLRVTNNRPPGKRQLILSDLDLPASLIPVYANLEKLSSRERQVMDLLSKGFIYDEIASKLQVSYTTVCTHIRHIYKKLQVNSRTRAVALYLEHCIALRSVRCDCGSTMR